MTEGYNTFKVSFLLNQLADRAKQTKKVMEDKPAYWVSQGFQAVKEMRAQLNTIDNMLKLHGMMVHQGMTLEEAQKALVESMEVLR